MIFSNDFESAAYKERIFFNNLNHLYQIFPDDKFIIDETHYTDHTRYDYLIHFKNCYKRLIVEIKIRTENFEDYIYETEKHKGLMAAKNLDPDNNTIIYINSTPKGTYIWNIDKIIGKYKIEKKMMNKATMASRTDKKDKSIYLLEPEDARYYEYHWDDKQFIKHIEEKKMAEDKLRRLKRQDKETIESILWGK